MYKNRDQYIFLPNPRLQTKGKKQSVLILHSFYSGLFISNSYLRAVVDGYAFTALRFPSSLSASKSSFDDSRRNYLQATPTAS